MQCVNSAARFVLVHIRDDLIFYTSFNHRVCVCFYGRVE